MAITASEYMSYTKDALATALASAENKLSRATGKAAALYEENQVLFDRVLDFGGSVFIGPLSALGVGFLETRYPNKDGTAMSLGPVPLPVVLSALCTVGAMFSPWQVLNSQLHYITASNLGLYAGSLGRGYGVERRAKALKGSATEGVGWLPAGNGDQPTSALGVGEEWSPEERALLAGDYAEAA